MNPNENEQAFLSENDADLFKSEASSSEDCPEKPADGQQILEVFRQNILKPAPTAISEEPKWYEFKENDGLSKMLERKAEEQKKEKERLELENKKKCRKIMKNPIEYINFIKTYLLCSLYNIVKISKVMFSELLQGYLLSKLTVEDLNFIDKLGFNYQKKKGPMDFLIRDLFRVFSKYFVFKKFNASYLLYNLAMTNNYTHEQISWLFIALCQYLRIPVRFLSIIDLTGFNLDRKYRVSIKSIEEEPGNRSLKKRKLEDFPKEIARNNLAKRRKNESNMIDKCLKSLIEKGNENIPKDSKYEEDSKGNDSESQKSEGGNIDLDNFLMGFEYKKATTGSKSIEKELPESMKKKLPSNLDLISNELLDINSFNYDNFKKSIEKDKPRPLFSDSYDSDEYKYWLEIYDYELNRWIVVNPILQEIYKEVLPKYIQAKIHNIPGLFIISSIKPLETMEYQVPKYIFESSGILLSDATIRYCEKWTKTLIHRKQLALKFWWDELMGKLEPRKVLKPSAIYQPIFESEAQLNSEIFKSDIPTNYNEFRNSPYYILPSHLRKYQGFKPDVVPIEDMVFKEEPVYQRSEVVDLHTKTRWKTMGRKVRQGQQGIKKVLALTNDGEQMVDLYGEWQTEELKNVLNEDGSLPKNEYGNYELFNGGGDKVPEGTLYIDLPFIGKLCKKYEIDHVDTVTGFEKKNGRCHPVKQGVLIFEREKEKVLNLYEDYAKEILEKEQEKDKKKVISVWKKLMKSLLIKRYIRENYENM